MPNKTTYSGDFYERVFKFAFNKLDRIWIVPERDDDGESIHTMSSLRNTASIGIPTDFYYVAGARTRPYFGNTIWIGRPNNSFLRTQLRVSLLNSVVEKIGRSGETCKVPLISQDGKDVRIEIGKSIIDKMKLFNGVCLSLAFDEIELMACGSIEELSVMMDLACIA